MTGSERETDKTQFGKDAVDQKDDKVRNDAFDAMAKTGKQSKVYERPRSTNFKYTGSIYPKLMVMGTGEVKKVGAKNDELKAVLRAQLQGDSGGGEGGNGAGNGPGKVSEKASEKVSEKASDKNNEKNGDDAGQVKIEPAAKPAPEKPKGNPEAKVAPEETKDPPEAENPEKAENSEKAENPEEEQTDPPGEIQKPHEKAEQKPEENPATVETADGKTWKVHKDGPSVLLDDKGRIEEIAYQNGSYALTQFDDKGELSRVRFPDGAIWEKAGDDHWVAVDDKGQPIDPENQAFYGKLEAGEDGRIRLDDIAGNTAIVNSDASRTTIYGDGSIVNSNYKGDVTKVVYPPPHHRSAEFSYKDGALQTVNYGNGNVWEKTGSGQWINKMNGDVFAGEFKVNKDGSVHVKGTGDATTRTDNTNGSHVVHLEGGRSKVEDVDNSAVHVDKTDHINRIDYPQGQKREFVYKGDEVREVKYEDPEAGYSDTWKREGGRWHQYQNDVPTGKSWDGDIMVDQSTGEFIYQTKDSPTLQVEKTDGSILTVADSGVVEVKTSNGDERRYTRNEDGTITGFEDRDGKWTTKDGVRWSNNEGKVRIGAPEVSNDGTFIFREKGQTRYEYTSGESTEVADNGGRKVYDVDGRLTQTIDAEQRVYKYGYGENGEINQITGPDGVTWKSDDGKNWTTRDGDQSFNGSVALAKDGTLKIFDEANKKETSFSLDGSKRTRDRDPQSDGHGSIILEKNGKTTIERHAVDKKAMEAAADAFFAFADGMGTNVKGMQAQLRGKTDEERVVMNEIFKTKHGYDMAAEIVDEMDPGAEREETLALLNRKDAIADDAGFVRTALAERDQLVFGDSDEQIESRMRQKIAAMTADEIQTMNEEFKVTDPAGRTALEAIAEDPNLSEETKAAIAVFGQGRENVSDKEALSVAEKAIESADIQLFKEAMSMVSPEARKEFMDGQGQEKLENAFGGAWYNALSLGLTGNVSDDELRHATDYASYGKLSAETQVEDNTSWAGDSESSIELAIEEMTADERKAYERGKELSGSGAAPESMTPDQKADLEYYNTLNTALKSAGNETEVKRWEDMIKYEGGSLVSKAAEHRGSFYDSKVQTVIDDIEKMSESDWKRLKSDPKFRDSLEGMYRTYMNESEMAHVEALLDKKQAANTFKESQESGRRDVLDALTRSRTFNQYDSGKAVDALVNMTPAEREAFKKNTDGFRDKVDAAMRVDPGMARAYEYIKEKIDSGKTPVEDIVTKMYSHATETTTDEGKVISEIVDAFDKDPGLREKIQNPKTDEERAFAQKFETAARQAAGTFDYDSLVAPLVEKGTLSIDKISSLYKDTFDDDEVGFYKAMKYADKEDLAAVAGDAASNLPFLSADEQAVAANIARQNGEMRPEDKIRAFQIGAGTLEKEIKDLVATMTPQQIEQMKLDYARKYGSDLTADLMDELGGKDLKDVTGKIEREKLAGDAYSDSLSDWSESRSGIGSDFVDNVWDGSGHQSDEAMLAYTKGMSEFARQLKEMPPEQQKQFQEGLVKALDLYRQSKNAVADSMVDAVMAVAAVGGALYTGGVSLGLLAGVGLGGGAMKTATKAGIVGADYDFNSTDSLIDFASGATDAMLSFVGPGQVGKVFKVGEAAAAQAAKDAVRVGYKMVTEGGESLIEADLKTVMRNAMISGSKEISEKELVSIAAKVVPQGAEKEFAKTLKQMMDIQLQKEASDYLKHLARQYALEMTAGGLGGGLGATVRGLAAMDESKGLVDNLGTVAQNFASGAGFGALGASAIKTAMKTGGAMLDAIGLTGDDAVQGPPSYRKPSPAEAESGKLPPEIRGEKPADTIVDEPPVSEDDIPTGVFERPEIDDDTIIDETPFSEDDIPTGVFERPEIDDDTIIDEPPLDQDDIPTGVFERPEVDDDPTGKFDRPVDDDDLTGGSSKSDGPDGDDGSGGDLDRLKQDEIPTEIIDLNKLARDAWVEDTALAKPDINAGAKVSDGTSLFDSEEVVSRFSDTGSKVIFEASGTTTELLRPPGTDFFFKNFPSSTEQFSSVKVHVSAGNVEDLGKLQSVLIPAMQQDEVLKSLVHQWKTLDPRHVSMGKSPIDALGPTGVDQGAKAFTIYAKTAAEALEIQKRVDAILAQYPELKLANALDTNNVDSVFGKTNRVGVVREAFEKAPGSDAGDQRVKIDQPVADAILADRDLLLRAAENEVSITQQLESELGLAPNTLVVEGGVFSLKMSPVDSRHFAEYENILYLQENEKGKAFGSMKDRTAMYAIYKHYGIDPSMVSDIPEGIKKQKKRRH